MQNCLSTNILNILDRRRYEENCLSTSCKVVLQTVRILQFSRVHLVQLVSSHIMQTSEENTKEHWHEEEEEKKEGTEMRRRRRRRRRRSRSRGQKGSNINRINAVLGRRFGSVDRCSLIGDADTRCGVDQVRVPSGPDGGGLTHACVAMDRVGEMSCRFGEYTLALAWGPWGPDDKCRQGASFT